MPVPAIRWFREIEPKLAGCVVAIGWIEANSDAHEFWISADISPDEVTEVARHEAFHLYQRRLGDLSRLTKAEVEQEAERFAARPFPPGTQWWRKQLNAPHARP